MLKGNYINIFILVVLLLSTCGCNSQNTLTKSYNLMPWPQEIIETTTKFEINSDVTISINGNDNGRVHNAAVNFLRRLSNRTGVFINHGFPLTNSNGAIEVSFNKISNLSIQDDESYTLNINNNKIKIDATTDVGALRALETLLQLIDNNETNYFFPGVKINDAPRFVWRGLMIDVARHFQPIDVIKRNLDAMASVKMNVFHWHLTDDQGFRAESKIYPKLQQLATDGFYYTQEQMKDVVAYASNLGIRVIPEIDVPGHASAILTAYPELGSKEEYSYSIERFSGVFHPTLDPTNDFTYEFLDNLFTEIAALFPDEYFHIGGDENEGKHWDENLNIQKFKNKNGLETNHDLQTYFNIKLEKILKKLGKKLMGWDEIMTNGMPTTAVIHSWRGEHEGFAKGGTLIDAAKKGYSSVLSAGYYIDRMLSVEHHYSVDPIGDVILTDEERARVLGGEATMWSELVTPLTIDSRVWPRTAAIAERFWSPKEVNDIDDMKRRLKDVNYKLEELGITHLRNRDAILRGMTHNQDISSLFDLSKICEPLKVYSRNKGGTEYKSFSPFTLFADACTADAEDAGAFENIVNHFTKDQNEDSKEKIIEYLGSWINAFSKFEKLRKNPILNQLQPQFKNLALISELLVKNMNQGISKEDLSLAHELLEKLKTPIVDVELVVCEDLNKLLVFLNK